MIESERLWRTIETTETATIKITKSIPRNVVVSEDISDAPVVVVVGDTVVIVGVVVVGQVPVYDAHSP